MLSKFDVKKFALWVFIIMVLAFVGAGSIFAVKGVNGTFFSVSSGTSNNYINDEKSFASQGIKDINIDTINTDIKIIPSDTSDIKVHFYGEYSGNADSLPQLVTDQLGSKLNIQVKHKIKINIGVNFYNDNTKLEVYVPKNYSENIALASTSGSGNISGLSLNKLKFSSTSGELNVSALDTKETSFNSTSGSMRASGLTGNLSFNSTSGELNAEYSNFNSNLKVNTVSGEVNLKLPEKSEFTVKFNATSGELRSDFPFSLTGTTNSKHNFEGSVGNSTNSIIVSSVSGGLRITK